MENKGNKTANTNKEGGFYSYIIVLKDSKCSDCGACVPACPKGIFRVANGEVIIDENKTKFCNGCIECKNVCDTGAINISYPNFK